MRYEEYAAEGLELALEAGDATASALSSGNDKKSTRMASLENQHRRRSFAADEHRLFANTGSGQTYRTFQRGKMCVCVCVCVFCVCVCRGGRSALRAQRLCL
jgi:hypothetical protein|eukprot:COSAG06_NODE_2893_length_6126_cov_6.083790_5_plen_102_part_00